MRRLAFAAFVLAGSAVIVLGAAKGVGYEPPNPADLPKPQESTAALVQASVRGCVEGLGVVEIGVSDGVVLVRCKPTLGVHKP